MVSFGSQKGKRGRNYHGGGKQSNNGRDFRWKKKVGKRKREPMPLETADSTDFIPPQFLDDAHQDNNFEVGTPHKKKESKLSIKNRQREAKRRRREMHDKDRKESDEMILSAPHKFIWSKYEEWCGGKLSSAERKAEEWSSEQVYTIYEDEEKKIIDYVKDIVGPDYISQGGWKKSSKPGMACVVLASSALRAVHLAPSIYDGKPVGKLFSKHIKIEEQRAWIKQYCSKKLAPSAVGTSKRVQRLVEEDDMTLEHTVALILDFKRDNKDRNILDFPTCKDELFDLIFTHCRSRMNEGKMKMLLIAPNRSKQEEGDDNQQVDPSGEQ